MRELLCLVTARLVLLLVGEAEECSRGSWRAALCMRDLLETSILRLSPLRSLMTRRGRRITGATESKFPEDFGEKQIIHSQIRWGQSHFLINNTHCTLLQLKICFICLGRVLCNA